MCSSKRWGAWRTRAADFDGDGDLDVLVAEFGWRLTGRVLLLEQQSFQGGRFQFKTHVVDERHGASHVPIVDLDGDGRLDFVALISQEHETVVTFTNGGKNSFRAQTLFSAPDPSYGSTAIQLADLDADGDVDVLLTNGDSFDSHILKPEHSLQWLENLGDGRFEHRHVEHVPGAYIAATGDLDGDGDLDIALCTMTWDYKLPFNSVLWFEQASKGEFVRHNLDFSVGQHAALELGDFDGDGDLDLAVGEFETRPVASESWFTVWWNEGLRNAELLAPRRSQEAR